MKAPMHIGLGVLCGTTGGPATYGIGLARALVESGEVNVTVLTDGPDKLALPGIEVVHVPTRGGVDRLRWQHWALPRALAKVRPDVYHDTKNALPAGLRMPGVVTIHDLAYHTVPRTFGFASRLFLRRSTKHAVRRAQAIVVPSQATAVDLARIHPDTVPRIHVVPHGIDPAPAVSEAHLNEVRMRLGLPKRYVLHVGTVQARKNVDIMVHGVRLLRSYGVPRRALVVGRRGWLAKAALREIARDDTAMWIPHVDAADLAAIYAGADAFVSPSAYEGFGFAVADALAAGVPVVIADTSSLPELCGDAAVRLRELSADGVAEVLAALLKDPDRIADLRRRGPERAATFLWRYSAEGHLRAYRAALAGWQSNQPLPATTTG